MTFTGQPNAALKLKPSQPCPRLTGSAKGRFLTTGPGKPIETASYFQSPMIFFTPMTICLAVSVELDSNFLGSRSPVTSSFTCVPPTSMTSTFIRSDSLRPRKENRETEFVIVPWAVPLGVVHRSDVHLAWTQPRIGNRHHCVAAFVDRGHQSRFALFQSVHGHARKRECH